MKEWAATKCGGHIKSAQIARPSFLKDSTIMSTIFKYEKTQLNHRVFYKLSFSKNSNYIVSNPQVISCLRILLYPILFNYLWRAGTKCKCFQPNVPTVSVHVWKPPNNLLQPMQHQLHKGLSSSKLFKLP